VVLPEIWLCEPKEDRNGRQETTSEEIAARLRHVEELELARQKGLPSGKSDRDTAVTYSRSARRRFLFSQRLASLAKKASAH
jgi:hypothetical protein